MIENLKDPLIVSAIFFAASSTWFDGWLQSLFPSAANNPVMWGLLKTAVFALMYLLYSKYGYLILGGDDKNKSASSQKTSNNA